MFHETSLRVRYAETDKMGIVHHSNHIIWWEMARTALLRDIGLPYSELEARGVACPVIEIHCRYRHPAHFEDELVVRTTIMEVSPVKIRFAYEIINPRTGSVVATGESLHAFTDMVTGKPTRLNKSHASVWQTLLSGGKAYFMESQG